jgi:hypothetical protein
MKVKTRQDFCTINPHAQNQKFGLATYFCSFCTKMVSVHYVDLVPGVDYYKGRECLSSHIPIPCTILFAHLVFFLPIITSLGTFPPWQSGQKVRENGWRHISIKVETNKYMYWQALFW